MSSGCNCGSSCSCGDNCRCGEEIKTTQTIIVGVAPVKMHYDGSERSYGAENDGCNCGSSCSCDTCKCGK